MKIRNAIIITDAYTEISMTLEEQADFTGNVVLSRDKLSSVLAQELDSAAWLLARRLHDEMDRLDPAQEGKDWDAISEREREFYRLSALSVLREARAHGLQGLGLLGLTPPQHG